MKIIKWHPQYFFTWYKIMINKMDASFCQSNLAWIITDFGQFDEWVKKLFDDGKEPEQAAAIIERAHRMYINTETR